MRMGRSRGFTLIELVIAVAISAILLSLGAAGMSGTVRNGRIRTAADALQAGVQTARMEAIKTNSQVCFQADATGGWVVRYNDAGDDCGGAQVQARPAGESGAVVVAVSPGLEAIIFNGLGLRTQTSRAAGEVHLDVYGSGASDCQAAGGQDRCLRVTVSAIGDIRLCDPVVADTSPVRCP